MTRKYGTPDAETPELTDADFAAARSWRPSDPVGPSAGPAALRETTKLRDALKRVVTAYERGESLDDAIADARAALVDAR